MVRWGHLAAPCPQAPWQVCPRLLSPSPHTVPAPLLGAPAALGLLSLCQDLRLFLLSPCPMQKEPLGGVFSRVFLLYAKYLQVHQYPGILCFVCISYFAPRFVAAGPGGQLEQKSATLRMRVLLLRPGSGS